MQLSVCLNGAILPHGEHWIVKANLGIGKKSGGADTLFYSFSYYLYPFSTHHLHSSLTLILYTSLKNQLVFIFNIDAIDH